MKASGRGFWSGGVESSEENFSSQEQPNDLTRERNKIIFNRGEFANEWRKRNEQVIEKCAEIMII